MIRLSDLYAPNWSIPVGDTVWEMRPLSLATLAEAEGRGIFMEQLQSGKPEPWFRFLEFISGQTSEVIAKTVTEYPLVFEVFQQKVLWAFGSEEPEVKVNRRQVKNPLKDKKEEAEVSSIDFGFLITLSRVSGIALSDLFRMTLRGLSAVQDSLKELPPAPKLF